MHPVMRSLYLLVVGLLLAASQGANADILLDHLKFGETTRDQFAAMVEARAPRAVFNSVTEDTELTVDSVKFDNVSFGVRATFERTDDFYSARLIGLELRAIRKWKGSQLPSYAMLSGFAAKSTDRSTYVRDSVEAHLSVVAGYPVIKFKFIPPPPPPSPAEIPPIEWKYLVMEFVFLLMVIVVPVMVVYGNWQNYRSRRKGHGAWAGARTTAKMTSAGVLGADALVAQADNIAINPANGQLMIGGEGGVDTYGNSFGSDFNDPS